MVQNHNKGPFDPKYIGNYRVVSIKRNQIEIRPSIRGPTEMKHIKHVKYIHPVDQYVKHVPASCVDVNTISFAGKRKFYSEWNQLTHGFNSHK